MRRKQLWIVIAGLILLNCLTLIFFLAKVKEVSGTAFSEEVVASVGKSDITRQQWLNELEARYGKDVLKDMIDQKVIKEMADKYHIEVSEKDVEREYRILQTTYSSPSENKKTSERKWKEHIRNSLLQEEILTRDVKVSKKEMQAYFEKNKELFSIPDTYHVSHIIVKSSNEAENAIKELEQGSSFSVLAMERSIEEFSANVGGDIGFLIEGEERYPSEYIQVAKKLKEGAWSDPIQVEQGFAIVKLEEKIKGKTYNYDEVKQQIRREIALEQMKTSASATTFWEEAKVEWFYGKTSAN
ncbi:peptidyl-prolyl cis-trans isomerase [Neobacillus sp. 179-C4.2 HS]|uniref:peptidylprolyl isomerase n=1 Tax=Neobacillus driksii TaxID=3035913 RepID=A0ABV4Z340_9BACI|nr:peptidyl-prolyl cis-trans isomerase [Neobacillus sp. 179.-C4.2 HS]MDP5197618.1 peptidyl-prolyl cis-trans isomerase [Neobacillus sp. 179.-C4.2 HS]